jgi:hypothetical protein
MKIAVFFPGIGYTCERPLLYYSRKLAQRYGYEVAEVPYGNFPSDIRGDKAKMEQAFQSAMEQTEQLLQDIDWSRYSEILFVSKSIGTIVAGAYSKQKGIFTRNIYFTPLVQTFQFPGENAIVFHGTADPWANTADIEKECLDGGFPLYLVRDANHSLETGDVARDIRNLGFALEQADAYMNMRGKAYADFAAIEQVEYFPDNY